MEIFVRVKAVGKRRPILEGTPYILPESVHTLRELLTELVWQEVTKYNKKETEAQLLPFLSAETIENQKKVGKIGFGRIYSDKKANLEKAIANAIQCYEDGLVRVFQNETELTELDEKLIINEEDYFTLIRLTFLAGRMW